MRDPVLPADERAFLAAARRFVLATIGSDGRPRLVPVCFVVHGVRPVLYSPIDEKPKTVADPADLARLRDIAADRRVSVLVDRWDEDWTLLGWLRCNGTASVVAPDAGGASEHARAVAALRGKYPQYASHDLEARPIIRIAIQRTVRWGSLALP